MSLSNTEEKYYALPEETFMRVCGRQSEHLKLIETEFGVRLVTRGNEIRIARNGAHPTRAYRVLEFYRVFWVIDD